MPPRTRVPKDAGNGITEATEHLQIAMKILQGLDLAGIPEPTREYLRTARTSAQDAVAASLLALRAEIERLSIVRD